MALTLDTRELPDDLTRSDVLAATRRAAATWTAPACTSMRISIEDGSAKEPGGHEDGRSSIAIHKRHFCEAGVERGKCYDSRAASVTNVRLGSSLPNGEAAIKEVDIALNAGSFAWTTGAGHGPLSTMDLETVVLHELGHALGLDHVCVRGSAGISRRDHRGEPRPQCAGADEDVSVSVMVPAGDQILGASLPRRRALSADDVRAVCELYPALTPPPSHARGCDCRLRPDGSPKLASTAAALGLALFWLRRRSRRAR